jgi:CO/xanthine dehydrogenase Mo-binding subunit
VTLGTDAYHLAAKLGMDPMELRKMINLERGFKFRRRNEP